MSEYQYYEFRAIDRPLNQDEKDELRDLSTRAEITSTSFTNTYNFGSFKGDPAKLMDRYFDAFVYVANWGSHRLMFRIPSRFLDAETVEPYCDDETFTVDAKNHHIVLKFSSEDEPDGDWDESERWMSSLISLRADLMRGDLRALYLAWLASLCFRDEYGEDDDGEIEPPVPPGLAKLTAPLRELAEFLRVDDELIEAAAAGSRGEAPAEPSHVEIAGWIQKLPAAEKDAYLLRLFAGEGDLLLRAELSKQFREDAAPKPSRPAKSAGRRTVAQLLAAHAALVKEKQRKADERASRERERLQREKAEARTKHLDDLTRREPAAWKQVETLIATRIQANYDEAVTLLVDLSELAARASRPDFARTRIQEIRRNHAGKSSLMKRFDAENLGI